MPYPIDWRPWVPPRYLAGNSIAGNHGEKRTTFYECMLCSFLRINIYVCLENDFCWSVLTLTPGALICSALGGMDGYPITGLAGAEFWVMWPGWFLWTFCWDASQTWFQQVGRFHFMNIGTVLLCNYFFPSVWSRRTTLRFASWRPLQAKLKQHLHSESTTTGQLVWISSTWRHKAT